MFLHLLDMQFIQGGRREGGDCRACLPSELSTLTHPTWTFVSGLRASSENRARTSERSQMSGSLTQETCLVEFLETAETEVPYKAAAVASMRSELLMMMNYWVSES